jgi:hypothetical protein
MLFVLLIRRPSSRMEQPEFYFVHEVLARICYHRYRLSTQTPKFCMPNAM